MIWLTVIFIFFISCVVTRHPAISDYNPSPPDNWLEGIELPYFEDTTFVIRNQQGRYTLKYDTAHRSANWVAYILTATECSTKGVGRTDKFIPDPQVVASGWPSARTTHYSKSGYDRGHLLPSADRRPHADENKTTFYLSNISPQHPKLNRGVWKRLEEKTREWALRYDSLYIVTGAIVEQENPSKIKGNISVPSSFYKALLVKSENQWYSIAFVMPNSAPKSSALNDHLITVRQLENFCGYNFFCALPDLLANEVETVIDTCFWY